MKIKLGVGSERDACPQVAVAKILWRVVKEYGMDPDDLIRGPWPTTMPAPADLLSAYDENAS